MAARPPSSVPTDPAPARRKLRAVMTAIFWGTATLVLAVTLLGGREGPPADALGTHAPPAASATVTASAAASASASATRPEPSRSDAPQPAGTYLPRSAPTRLRIPDIKVDAPFTDLAIGASGQLDAPPPDDINLVGWFADGASPGERGTSIIAGHVDTKTSAAVFARLSELEKGDRFEVERADGREAKFVVDHVESFAKDGFPDERVYADTDDAQVRLITCSGDYDRKAKDYTENLVVFAHLV
ncbi:MULTISPECIES: class F sortase [unclassified Streptomyces]|uniref:class F sortase n=1 Tax=unclassified Streptomyces TaxID=2593676 RepID=UPI00086D485B|nr:MULTISPECIES: class F sortase [unclassified Streptomyces]ODA75253.1 Sortase family protein [Streptomyces sp. AVP053U2]